jgi:hypothetical protein
MSVKSVDGLRYVVVPTKLSKNESEECIKDHNAVYNFWVSHWTKAFASTGAPQKGWEDHFLRQDFATGLVLGDEVIACHLYSTYDLRSSAAIGSEYLHYISEPSIAKLKAKNYINLVSMEYLGVNSEYRINSTGVSLGEVIGTLGVHMAEAIGADGVLGMPISTTKVDKMMYNISGEVIQEGIEKYGYSLHLQVAPSAPRPPSRDPAIENQCSILWRARTDHTGLSLNRKAALKIAV